MKANPGAVDFRQGSGFRVDGAPYIRLEGRNLRVLDLGGWAFREKVAAQKRRVPPRYRLSAVFEGAFP